MICLIASALLLTSASCEKGLQLAPAEGVVTLDGQPVPEAAVMFLPDGGGPAATGVTDADGRFVLHTTNQRGAVVGKHRVTVNKQQVSGLVDGLPGPSGLQIRHLVPAKYGRVDTSGLVAAVENKDNDFRFALQLE